MNRLPVLPILRHSLQESWRSFIGWSIGIIAALCLYLPLFSSLGSSSDLQKMVGQLPPELTAALGYQNIATGAGYAQSTFFGLLGYLLFSIAAISWGSQAIGADEERGTLELTLAHGVGRGQLLFERWAALVIRMLGLGIIVFVTILVLNGPSDLKLSVGGVAAGALALCIAALLSGTAAVVAGALIGRRTVALLGGAGVAVVGYVLNAVGNQGDSLKGLLEYSPIHWAYGNEPLLHGLGGGMWLLFACIVVLLAVGLLRFRTRDIGR